MNKPIRILQIVWAVVAVGSFLWAMSLQLNKDPDLFLALAFISFFSIIISFILSLIK